MLSSTLLTISLCCLPVVSAVQIVERFGTIFAFVVKSLGWLKRLVGK